MKMPKTAAGHHRYVNESGRYTAAMIFSYHTNSSIGAETSLYVVFLARSNGDETAANKLRSTAEVQDIIEK